MKRIKQGPGNEIVDFDTGDILVDGDGFPVEGVVIINRGYAETRHNGGLVVVVKADMLHPGKADEMYLYAQDVLNMAEMVKRMGYDDIADRTLETINAYVRRGQQPGHFVEAVASNDLAGAVSRADDRSAKALPAIVRYFHSRTPAACWGSPGAVQAWIKQGGAEGSGLNYDIDLIER